MSVEQVSKMVLAFLKVLAWPVVVIVAVTMFRKELTSLLGRLESLDGLGIQSKFRRAVAETVEGAEAAEEDARKLAAAVKGAAENIAEPAPASKPETEANEPAESSDEQHAPVVTSGQRPESTTWSAIRLGIFEREAHNPQGALIDAWRRLEDETARVTSSIRLGGSKKAAAVAANPRDPVALYEYLFDHDIVSEGTMLTVRRAHWLTTAFGGYFRNEAYRREVVEVAEAVDSLRRSLRSIGVMLAGQSRVQELLDEYGDDPLPTR
ncbi:hypothetical protein [uncultured Microbacterium sp.]|uniref:hypothetical protein n=1 Tax=uncultured Microbacterium sp. TaxID=191216 RepID=UPI0025FC8D3B|nr:hypothetical protein [uncultured Microbacterium sp.]